MDDETVEDIRYPHSPEEDSLFEDDYTSDEGSPSDRPVEQEFRNLPVIFGGDTASCPLEERDTLDEPDVQIISRRDTLLERC